MHCCRLACLLEYSCAKDHHKNEKQISNASACKLARNAATAHAQTRLCMQAPTRASSSNNNDRIKRTPLQDCTSACGGCTTGRGNEVGFITKHSNVATLWNTSKSNYRDCGINNHTHQRSRFRSRPTAQLFAVSICARTCSDRKRSFLDRDLLLLRYKRFEQADGRGMPPRWKAQTHISKRRYRAASFTTHSTTARTESCCQ